MARIVRGRCWFCDLVFRWAVTEGAPRLKEAACPHCGADLHRTSVPVRLRVAEEVPLARLVRNEQFRRALARDSSQQAQAS